MKHIVSGILAVVVALASAFAMTGCDTEPKTLEDYLSDSPTAQKDIEESLDGLNNDDMEVSVSYSQNRIIITCDLQTTYKKEAKKAMKKSFRKYISKNMAEQMESSIAAIEHDTGITGVSIQLIINNGDGEEMYSQIFPDTAAEEAADPSEEEAADPSTEEGTDQSAE